MSYTESKTSALTRVSCSASIPTQKARSASEKANKAGASARDHAEAADAHKAAGKTARVIARQAVAKSIKEIRAPNEAEDRKAEDWNNKAKAHDAKAKEHQDKATSMGWEESKHPRGPDGKFT